MLIRIELIGEEALIDYSLITVRCALYRAYVFSVLLLGPPVKFGDDPNLPDEECHYLLKEYMPDHVTKNKVLQQLFIKYELTV